MSETREGAKLIEVVHLAFLQALPSRMPPGSYIVKGGANLRLFEQSARRSQDIDLDFAGRPDRFDLVEDQVDAVLRSGVFGGVLQLAGVAMSEPTKPKQTSTTRRWKFSVEGAGAFLNSKIEFSNRGVADPEHALETARDDIGRALGLRVVRANRYLPPAAVRQKIRALGQRSESEPRDVFDLDLLFARHPSAVERGDVPAGELDAAVAAALSIEYEAYRDLVVEFIEDDQVAVYERPEVWTDMVLKVVEKLEALR
jgi:Nucleotidyl transferase AbiEii toxin, Type IV TA system